MTQSIGQYSTTTEAEQMLELARRLKVKKFTFAWKDGQNIYAEFWPETPVIPQQSLGADSMPTEDELLYWSTSFEENIKAEPPE